MTNTSIPDLVNINGVLIFKCHFILNLLNFRVVALSMCPGLFSTYWNYFCPGSDRGLILPRPSFGNKGGLKCCLRGTPQLHHYILHQETSYPATEGADTRKCQVSLSHPPDPLEGLQAFICTGLRQAEHPGKIWDWHAVTAPFFRARFKCKIYTQRLIKNLFPFRWQPDFLISQLLFVAALPENKKHAKTKIT